MRSSELWSSFSKGRKKIRFLNNFWGYFRTSSKNCNLWLFEVWILKTFGHPIAWLTGRRPTAGFKKWKQIVFYMLLFRVCFNAPKLNRGFPNSWHVMLMGDELCTPRWTWGMWHGSRERFRGTVTGRFILGCILDQIKTWFESWLGIILWFTLTAMVESKTVLNSSERVMLSVCSLYLFTPSLRGFSSQKNALLLLV